MIKGLNFLVEFASQRTPSELDLDCTATQTHTGSCIGPCVFGWGSFLILYEAWPTCVDEQNFVLEFKVTIWFLALRMEVTTFPKENIFQSPF